jgi:hypothetical protein
MFRTSFTTVALATCSSVAQAGLTSFASRADFNAAFPIRSFEDFEEARVDSGGFGQMDGPLDQFTDNSIFRAGEIVAGLRIVTPAFGGPGNMFIHGAGFGSYTSKGVSFNDGGTPSPQLSVSLSGGDYRGFAMDVTCSPFDGCLVVVEYWSDQTLLGTTTVIGTGSGAFVGVSSDQRITLVTLSSPSTFFGLDNVAFAVPAPGAAGLLPLAGLAGSRRRRA